jgi:hypothetical protein
MTEDKKAEIEFKKVYPAPLEEIPDRLVQKKRMLGQEQDQPLTLDEIYEEEYVAREQ